MNTPAPQDKLDAIKDALFRGEKIAAIKLYRQATNAGLAEAKNAVERLEAELREKSPEKFAPPRARSGCMGVLVTIAVVTTAAVWWVVRHRA